ARPRQRRALRRRPAHASAHLWPLLRRVAGRGGGHLAARAPARHPARLRLRRRVRGPHLLLAVDRVLPARGDRPPGRVPRRAGRGDRRRGSADPRRGLPVHEARARELLYALRLLVPLAAREGAAPGRALSARQGKRNSPRATITAQPPTSIRSIRSALPVTRAYSVDGRPISAPCSMTISSPKAMRP